MMLAASLMLSVSACGATPRPSSHAPVEPRAVEGEVFDDFDGPAGSPPNQALWDPNVGPYRDAGLQNYTDTPANVRLDGDGHLVVQALKTPTGYSSARLVGKRSMQYGRVSARIKFPEGQGIWPAFWMLGTNYGQVGWPRSGEVDLIEIVNSAREYHVTLHGPQGGTDYYGGGDASGQVVGTSGPIENLALGFHEYWLDWKPNNIVIGVDHVVLARFSPASLPAGAEWVFNRPMFAILNVAVGGPWPGAPDASTPFPATMLVDWFRYVPAAS
jgi:beta-glucanase (GH16 family)